MFTSVNEAVKSADRVLDLLELFAGAAEPMGVSQVSRLLAIPKSSAQALLGTLAARAYLVRTGSTYELARDFRRDGWVGGAVARLVKIAVPVMQRLAAASGESAFLNVLLPNGELRYVAKAVSPNVLRYDAPLSNTRPAYCTSSGVVLLGYLTPWQLEAYFAQVKRDRKAPQTATERRALVASLQRAREQGYAELCDAHIQGASGVAAPVFNGSERPVAALSLAAPTPRFVQRRMVLRKQLVAAAAALSRRLQAGACHPEQIASPGKRRAVRARRPSPERRAAQ